MSSILDLAPELLELVLSFLSPKDLICFALTCRHVSGFVQPDNQILWKASFLQVFDHPKHAWASLVPTARAENQSREAEWDWYHELQRRFIAFNAVCKSDQTALLTGVEDVVRTLLDVEETASCKDKDEDGNARSLNVIFLEQLTRERQAEEPREPRIFKIVHDYDYQRDSESRSLPLEHLIDSDRRVTRSMLARRVAVPEWASKFHIIHGPTEREQESSRAKAAARAIVYDWNVTGPPADFGPFKKDLSGAVDWQNVEAISSLMHRIIATALKMYKLAPTGFSINIPRALPLNVASPEDWAGATGTWLGTYAFLDYRALVHYNFAHDQEYPLDLGNYEEACGDLMRLELKIEDSEELKRDPRLQTELPRCKDLPVLFFKGFSHNESSGRPSIAIRGFASLVPGGRSVRWRFIIRYAGTDQWQLEGVQPGGVRSGPIYGLWSHVDRDEQGPMGPFYYAPAELCQRTQE
ncbi:hypothetical protein P280DRAFT_472038 [Massarina eburnea CBS 473.64]|uniref:F-box domain-containing protein n=1 Tax=Massarina eburnea CBS 473.64 TaxID=1395130 RepID=A0A6A6RRP0_9PLEO|nr:hypothetical protein P280DRAFT_472038 [Massarina eburnea CBS 473.64]